MLANKYRFGKEEVRYLVTSTKFQYMARRRDNSWFNSKWWRQLCSCKKLLKLNELYIEMATCYGMQITPQQSY